MAAADGGDPTGSKGNGTAKKEGIADVGLKIVLAAVGGGIGVLGFVAFFGAAILWVRMDKVGVPANEAIAVVPKSVLVTTGASFLVPSVLLAAVLLGALYLVAWGTEYEWCKKRPWIEWVRKCIRPILIAIALFLAAAPAVQRSVLGLQGCQYVFVTVAVFLLSAFCFVILKHTNFASFALAFVVAVVLLNGFVTYYRTRNDPEVEPAAVLRSNGAPVFGFFLAQTGDRVYLATQLPKGPLRLDAIPREEVTDMAVGEALRPTHAWRQAGRLAWQMCRVARERAKTGRTVAASSRRPKAAMESCTLVDLRRLRGYAPGISGTPAT